MGDEIGETAGIQGHRRARGDRDQAAGRPRRTGGANPEGQILHIGIPARGRDRHGQVLVPDEGASEAEIKADARSCREVEAAVGLVSAEAVARIERDLVGAGRARDVVDLNQ